MIDLPQSDSQSSSRLREASANQAVHFQLQPLGVLVVRGRLFYNITKTMPVAHCSEKERIRRWTRTIFEAVFGCKFSAIRNLNEESSDFSPGLDRVVDICLMETFSSWIKPQAIKYRYPHPEIARNMARLACIDMINGHNPDSLGLETTLGFFKYCMGQNSTRVPFITNRGKVGLGLPSIQLGDAVVMIKGLRVPMILRKEGADRWTLVGPAYVEGLMISTGRTYYGYSRPEEDFQLE